MAIEMDINGHCDAAFIGCRFESASHGPSGCGIEVFELQVFFL
jgi:hypothetical protein